MSDEILIKVEHVKKKFCRKLRKSLRYGILDIAADLFGRPGSATGLREGEFWALEDVSLELRRGECLGLIGHNGAGKTSLLKMLNGLLKPDSGRITVRGRMGALIALGAGFNPILSGRENIYVNGAVLGLSKAEIDRKIEGIVAFAEIGEFIDSPVQSYSSGMAVRLGFAIAVHCQPDILLLDEVLAVGDAAFQAKCLNTLSRFREHGIGFILVSHNMALIDSYCNRVVYLKRGRVVYSGETEAGIAAYNSETLNEADAEQYSLGHLGPVCGSGKLVMRNVLFLNAAGKEIAEIGTGERVTLRIQYECHVPEVACPVVDIFIRDQGGVFFHLPNTITLGAVRGCGDIDVTFDSIPANNQKLLFSIAILHQHSREMYDWKHYIPLKVRGNPRCQGRIYLSCEWFVSQKSEEEQAAANRQSVHEHRVGPC